MFKFFSTVDDKEKGNSGQNDTPPQILYSGFLKYNEISTGKCGERKSIYVIGRKQSTSLENAMLLSQNHQVIQRSRLWIFMKKELKLVDLKVVCILHFMGDLSSSTKSWNYSMSS